MPRTLARPVIDPRRVHEALLRLLALLDFFVAATAIAGGLMMLLHPRGADAFVPAAWLERSPFLDAVVPGLALLIGVGGASLLAAVQALRRAERAPLGSALARAGRAGHPRSRAHRFGGRAARRVRRVLQRGA